MQSNTSHLSFLENAPSTSVKCCICNKKLAQKHLMSLEQLLPKLIRYIERCYPRIKYLPRSDTCICLNDLRGIIQTRLSELVEEDISQHSKLQEDAIKNMGLFEITEESWQDQFQEENKSFGDMASDMVAKWGGSWNFIGVLSFCLIAWIVINYLIDSLESIQFSAWDPYPYIFLTFVLSMIQTFQAPFIMMTQNRQDIRDRKESNYISKIILRNELQSRHVNAKIDHLISLQWKRLLEIQELQMFMFQVIQSSAIPQEALEIQGSSGQRIVFECKNDPFLESILRSYYGMPLNSDKLLFCRWNSGLGNYHGLIKNIVLNTSGLNLSSVGFDIEFSVKDATLDDILSGDRTVSLRNDFDCGNMIMNGRILEIQGATVLHSFSYKNGDMPGRYNTTFSEYRSERISEFWKESLVKLRIVYAPPMQFVAILVEPEETLEELSVFFSQSCDNPSTVLYQSCFVNRSKETFLEDKFDSIVKSLLGPSPLGYPWTVMLPNDKLGIKMDQHLKKKKSLEVHKIPTSNLIQDGGLPVLHVFYSQNPFTCSYEISK